MKIQENIPISKLTTMRLGGVARFVIEVENTGDLVEAYNLAREKNLPVWIIGGGANTIGRDEGWPGIVILNRMRGITVDEETENEILLTGMGGEIWDDFVEFATNLGYSGIEAMSKIPGTVGAAPVQNIGAYGQDLAQVVERVGAYDAKNGEFVTLVKSEMKMEYRTTRFNFGADAGRFFIVNVTARLKKGNLQPPFYTSLQKYVDENDVTDFSPPNIRRIVSEIRAEKLPDPKVEASAGSFFKNVIIAKEKVAEAKARGIPVWENVDEKDGWGGKINAGWLIEACGLKGKTLHGFRVSEKAALILINEDTKSYADLAKARAEIVNAVREKFGFVLEQEPVEVAT